jgi:hypothetical protein
VNGSLVDDSSDDDSSDDENAFPDTQLTTNSTEMEPITDSADEPKDKEWNKYDLEDYGEDAGELPDFAKKQEVETPRVTTTTTKKNCAMYAHFILFII